MTNEEILNSLRCCASVDGANCDNCNDEELGSDKLLACSDVLKCLAADLIEKLLDRCARYAEEIAVLQERTRWVPVSERLPKDRGNVLVVAFWHERWGVYMGWCAPERADWCVHVGLGDRDDVLVSHWRPLPEPPEVEG